MRVSCTAFLLTATLSLLAAAQSPTVTVDNAVYIGVTSQLPSPNPSVKVNQFLGMKYGEVPQRFKPAVSPANLTATVNATVYREECWNLGNGFYEYGIVSPTKARGNQSEDCLHINVYTPANVTATSQLPVMFFIYGGSFIQGYSDFSVYDGSYLAGLENVIVVTYNYRLGAFGWPGNLLPGVAHNEANLGAGDTRLALQWVKSKIGAFGGDPGSVTVFGESAGGMIADFIALTTPPDQALFHAFILESANYYIPKYGSGIFGDSRTGSNIQSIQILANRTGCPWDSNTINCLRALPADQLWIAEQYPSVLFFGPVEDGNTNVPGNFTGEQIRTSGGGSRVPMLTGTNANEAIFFTRTQNLSWNEFFENRFFEITADDRPKIENVYNQLPCDPSANATTCEWYRASQAMTDYMYTCLAAREARANAGQNVPTWRYQYNTEYGGWPSPWNYFAQHTFELPQVFGTFDPNVATAAQKNISRAMMTAWAKFARNPTQGPGWDRYTTQNDAPVGQFGTTITSGLFAQITANVTDFGCDLFKKYYDANDPPASGTTSRRARRAERRTLRA